MLTGLGPFEAVFPFPVSSRPIRKRFSDRTWLRDVHGRAGKRQRAVVEVLMPVSTAEADNPPPTAAIINYHNNCAGEVDRGGWNKMERRETVRAQSTMGKRVSVSHWLIDWIAWIWAYTLPVGKFTTFKMEMVLEVLKNNLPRLRII